MSRYRGDGPFWDGDVPDDEEPEVDPTPGPAEPDQVSGSVATTLYVPQPPPQGVWIDPELIDNDDVVHFLDDPDLEVYFEEFENMETRVREEVGLYRCLYDRFQGQIWPFFHVINFHPAAHFSRSHRRDFFNRVTYYSMLVNTLFSFAEEYPFTNWRRCVFPFRWKPVSRTVYARERIYRAGWGTYARNIQCFGGYITQYFVLDAPSLCLQRQFMNAGFSYGFENQMNSNAYRRFDRINWRWPGETTYRVSDVLSLGSNVYPLQFPLENGGYYRPNHWFTSNPPQLPDNFNEASINEKLDYDFIDSDRRKMVRLANRVANVDE